jgi:phospholipase/carboxylesterase
MHYYRRGMKSLVVGLMLLGALASPAAAQDPPSSQPGSDKPAQTAYGPGRYDLKLENGRDGVLFVPKGYKRDKPTPLLIWLHGAGGSGNVSENMAALADEFGFIVLAPDSRDWTWDAILGQYGPDVDYLQRALKQTLTRYNLDRDRIWLGGFSDGASYSLSLGISYGDIFRKIYAGAPGVMQPIEANGKPAIFISHGRQDQTMPIDETSRKFVPRLKALGYDVTYEEYDARHQLPPEMLRKVIEWFNKN